MLAASDLGALLDTTLGRALGSAMSIRQKIAPIGAVGAVVAAGLVGFALWQGPSAGPDEGGNNAPQTTQSAATETAVEPPEPTGAAEETAQAAPAEAPKAETETTPEPETEIASQAAATGPRFDVVRVDPLGSALIAGSATPGTEVRVMMDGVEIARVEGVSDGSFVAMVDVPPSLEPRVLSLTARDASDPEGAVLQSDDTVIVAPARIPGGATALASDAEGQRLPALTDSGGAAETASDAGKAAPSTDQPAEVGATETLVVAQPVGTAADAARPETSAPLAPSDVATDAARGAPAVLLASADGLRVLQPSHTGSRAAKAVVVDAISYDAGGAVTIAGRGGPNEASEATGRVRLYLDNELVETAQLAADGTWQTPLSEVKTGVYTLRVDQVDEAGRVVSRFETPFKREAAEVLARVSPVQSASGVAINVITVQPGSTLWGIADTRYGAGRKYVQIFEANQELIKDPNLIYPGQVFELPSE